MASEDNNVPSPPPTGDDGGGGGKEETSAEEGALSLKPGLPIRGIRMKFAVLTGLVEVGEVSNRDIVETVFNLVSRYLFCKHIFLWVGWGTRRWSWSHVLDSDWWWLFPWMEAQNSADLNERIFCIFQFKRNYVNVGASGFVKLNRYHFCAKEIIVAWKYFVGVPVGKFYYINIVFSWDVCN